MNTITSLFYSSYILLHFLFPFNLVILRYVESIYTAFYTFYFYELGIFGILGIGHNLPGGYLLSCAAYESWCIPFIFFFSFLSQLASSGES